jgi:hypothetical protein
MRVRTAFVVLSIAFGLAVLGAAVTTSNYVLTHQAQTHPSIARPAG